MIRSIEIKGFRGIQEGKLDDLTSLVVLVGPNGSGKSTILDALLLGASPRPGSVIRLFDTSRARVEHDPRWFLWRAGHEQGAEITVLTDHAQGKRVIQLESAISLNAAGGGGFSGGSSAHASQQPHFDVLFHLLQIHETETKDVVIGSISPTGLGGVIEQYPLPGVTDIHIVEIGSNGIQTPLVELFSRALEQGRREEARGIVADVLPGAANIEIAIPKGVSQLYVVYPDRAVPLAVAGDGTQALVRLCLELTSSPDGVVLLEEPEIHQHPRAISRSARAIWAAVRRGIQVVLTTHSLDLIDSLLAEANTDAELEQFTVYRTLLQDGCFRSVRVPGSDVAFQRVEIGDDLR